MVNGRCRDRCGLHQYKQGLLSFSLGKPRRQIGKEKGHETGYTLVQVDQDVFGSLGRSWPIFAGLDRIHFIDKGRSGTEVTAEPLEKPKGTGGKRGQNKGRKGSLDTGCNPAREYPFTRSFPTCIRKALLYKGELISGNAGIK